MSAVAPQTQALQTLKPVADPATGAITLHSRAPSLVWVLLGFGVGTAAVAIVREDRRSCFDRCCTLRLCDSCKTGCYLYYD